MNVVATAAFVSLLLSTGQGIAGAKSVSARQWQVTELTFTARYEYVDPFDIDRVRFWAELHGPGGRKLVVPGFWDGDTTWRVRFTPTVPGQWSYETHATNRADDGLHGLRGRLSAGEPTAETALRKHGGFLAVSENRRYLTYTDGTPFFWLGDTWWLVPSAAVPVENFKRMVDTRVKQGFTVFQAHGHRGFEAPPGFDVFQAVRAGGDRALRLWRETDRYIEYAESRGLVGVMGFAGHSVLDPISLSDLERLWSYFLARYAAYPITFLITQEYNADLGNRDERIAKVLELGRFIRQHDPYSRAMSAHPWVRSRDGREAWNEPWHDFAMLQDGHFREPRCESTLQAYETMPHRPILESESNYEGFAKGEFEVNAAVIRNTGYTAIQCGSFGFTYGAQGLYAGVTSEDRPGPTAKWGRVVTWDRALGFEGGRQLAHLAKFYRSMDWWNLEPWPGSRMTGLAHVKADRDSNLVVYVPRAAGARDPITILGLPENNGYSLAWFDPRTGRSRNLAGISRLSAGTLSVPEAPSSDDWILCARREE